DRNSQSHQDFFLWLTALGGPGCRFGYRGRKATRSLHSGHSILKTFCDFFTPVAEAATGFTLREIVRTSTSGPQLKRLRSSRFMCNLA
ncbi:MAG: hypothetical protein WCJ09_25980, partial [Planctomycetota bacterium]